MNKFEKISFEQYLDAITDGGKAIAEYGRAKLTYDEIKLPKRSTAKSAGYDFFSPFEFTLKPGKEIKILTGIKAQIDDNAFLALFPRSSLGFKYRLRLNNTVGIVDSDYYNNKGNEGHIFIKITNEGDKEVKVEKGEAFAQGIFIPFLLTVDDDSTEERVGGIGSTSK